MIRPELCFRNKIEGASLRDGEAREYREEGGNSKGSGLRAWVSHIVNPTVTFPPRQAVAGMTLQHGNERTPGIGSLRVERYVSIAQWIL